MQSILPWPILCPLSVLGKVDLIVPINLQPDGVNL